jgi:restriction system protein
MIASKRHNMAARRSGPRRAGQWFSILPWWAGLVLAPLLYGALVAAPNVLHVETPFFVGVDAVVQAMPRAAPYAAAVLLLLAAGNGWAEWQSARTGQSDTAHLRAFNARDLDEVVAEGFRQQSYVVEHTNAGPRLRKDGRVYVLNTTHCNAPVIGIGPVRDVHQTATTEMADGAVLVTSGVFTPEAQAFALLHHVTLISGDDLLQLVRDIQLDI